MVYSLLPPKVKASALSQTTFKTGKKNDFLQKKIEKKAK